MLIEHAKSNSKQFWKKIGTLGVANDRNSGIGRSVKLEDGSISYKPNDIQTMWHSEFKSLFEDNQQQTFDTNFLTQVEN
jgi:hypothetical protein